MLAPLSLLFNSFLHSSFACLLLLISHERSRERGGFVPPHMPRREGEVGASPRSHTAYCVQFSLGVGFVPSGKEEEEEEEEEGRSWDTHHRTYVRSHRVCSLKGGREGGALLAQRTTPEVSRCCGAEKW